MLSRAFTLIELLIVVAIIAILAAIAVPNFLEAQTRAKVVQQKANMRTIITGIESYRVDNNKMPYGTNYGGAHLNFYHIQLTTPIPYLTSVPQDLFYRTHFIHLYGPDYYYDYNIWDKQVIDRLIRERPGNQVTVTLQGFVLPLFDLWGHSHAHYVIRGFGPAFSQVYFHPYDPTNGTISDGHIVAYN